MATFTKAFTDPYGFEIYFVTGKKLSPPVGTRWPNWEIYHQYKQGDDELFFSEKSFLRLERKHNPHKMLEFNPCIMSI